MLKEEILELDYKKMVETIDEIVQDDFLFDMECKLLPKSKPFKQSEAVKMINKILDIYKISHTLHCKSCRDIKFAKIHKI